MRRTRTSHRLRRGGAVIGLGLAGAYAVTLAGFELAEPGVVFDPQCH